MSRGYGSRSVERVGEIIREILEEHGEMYGQEMYRIIKERTKQRSTYASFRANYLYKMHQLGLIEKTRTEPGQESLKYRQYWRITPGMETKEKFWRDPQGVFRQKQKKRKSKLQ